MLDVGIVVPVYEEAASIASLSKEIRLSCKEAGLTFEVWFIDDGSRDDSWAEILRQRDADERFNGIQLRRNYGKSAALAAGFEHVSARVVITMDADLQDDPSEIPSLVAAVDAGQDLVSGWKKARKDPWTKTLPSRFFNLVTRIVSGIPLHDFNCGLKAYRLEVVKSMKIYGEMHRYLPLLAKWEGFTRIGEQRVNHRSRQHGRSKFGFERYVRGCLDLMTVMFLTRFGARPMHFFGSMGLLAFLGGFVISLWITIDKFVYDNPVGDRPSLLLGVLLIMVGVQFMCTGFLGDLILRGRMKESQPYEIVEVVAGSD
ncbi:MAG: glycosyltransferase family 2 protein [Rhodothermaceae bacterium]|nr:glycosyltransferase family 2 protein [Rhodothermaceae bacterium]MYC04226.1 glycosyltransferase family 2 protein [Rhodothermaceae bacterium]MYI17043.1 glycosyltransferase family 2 protein [Rhodothermaceae bacterium]